MESPVYELEPPVNVHCGNIAVNGSNSAM
jgi:hypothetical protein